MTDLPDDLLRPILVNPADDFPRLVAADWWDERGEFERAEFVRVQVELSRLATLPRQGECTWGLMGVPGQELPCETCYPQAKHLRRRERELFDWFCRQDLACDLGLPNHTGLFPTADGVLSVAGPQMEFVFRRGFVSEVRCTLAEWYGEECGWCGGQGQLQDEVPCSRCRGAERVVGHGPAIARAQPVERAWLTDRNPALYPAASPQVYFWRLQEGGCPLPHDVPYEFFREQPLAMDAFRRFPTPDAATDALAVGAARWARQAAEGGR